jgi:Flp pilus assembly protein TadD
MSIIVFLFLLSVVSESTSGSRVILLESSRLYAEGDLGAAVELLGRAVEAEPENPELRFVFANALFRQERWKEAAQQYLAAAEHRPRHPDTVLGLGYSLYRSGEVDAAVEAWSVAVRLTPADALPHLSLAIGLLSQERPEEARDRFRVAVELDPMWHRRLEIDIRWTPAMLHKLSTLATSLVPEEPPITMRKDQHR